MPEVPKFLLTYIDHFHPASTGALLKPVNSISSPSPRGYELSPHLFPDRFGQRWMAQLLKPYRVFSLNSSLNAEAFLTANPRASLLK